VHRAIGSKPAIEKATCKKAARQVAKSARAFEKRVGAAEPVGPALLRQLMRPRLLLGLAIVLALAGAIGASLYFFQRSTDLQVAVERGSEEEAVLAAMAQKLARDHANVRFKLLAVDDLAESARALDQGRVDLAVVRSDVAMPANSASLLVMHSDFVLFILPSKSDFTTIAQLKGHKIGVLRDIPAVHGNARADLVETIFAQYGVAADAVTSVPLAPGDVAPALQEGRVDAILAVGVPESGPMAAAFAAVASAGLGEPAFIAIDEAKAIAERQPSFENTEMVRGVFLGRPPKPAKTLETLTASTRLVARSSLPDDVAANVTRLMLSARPELALSAPIANLIKAPSTDKDAALLAHPGAAAYLDDEQETFFDKYSDVIYITALCLSALGAAALASRIKVNRPNSEEVVLARLVEIVKASREADPATLETLEGEADDLLAAALAPEAMRLKTEAQRIDALGIAFEHTRHALKERRKTVGQPPRPAFGPRIVRD
jgi:TRAP transporter TAXI family solute receptor